MYAPSGRGTSVTLVLLAGLCFVAGTARAQPVEPAPTENPTPPPPEAPTPPPPEAPAPPAPPLEAPTPPPPAAPAPPPSAAPALPSDAAPALPPDAAPAPQPPATAAPPVAAPRVHAGFLRAPVELHGFVSEGAFWSTDNDFIGKSSRGSLEFFEAALNAQTQLTDKLHVGLQLFSQHQGPSADTTPRLDWAYLDYRWRPWLGLRAGRVRIPFGLYNDYIDIDAARLQILLPQSIYPIADRNLLTAQTGFALYGSREAGCAGSFDYQLWGGALAVPLPAAQDALGTRLFAYDSKYVIGAQVFWHPPIADLRVGASVLRGAFDTSFNLAPASVEQLQMQGTVPEDFDGRMTLVIDPATLLIGSVEYLHGDWSIAAEYSRWLIHTKTTPIDLFADNDADSERFYAAATHRLGERFDAGVYYSVLYLDASDRGGRGPAFPERFFAWSRDAAASLRFDVNEHWLWKLEAHFIDGVAALRASAEPPARYWGMFLARTTVTF